MASATSNGNITRVKNQPHYFKTIFTIENFLKCPAQLGFFFQSPPFQAISEDSDQGLKWCLRVYPFGIVERCGTVSRRRYVGVDIFSKSIPSNIVNIQAYYDVHVLGEDDRRLMTWEREGHSSRFHKHQTEEWSYFMYRETLIKERKHWLPSGHLTLECNIRAYYELKNPVCTTIILKTPTKIPRVKDSDTLKKIYRENVHPDVKLKSSDGRVFDAHKCILSVKSPYFKAMFQHPLKENREEIVDLSKSMNGQELESLLKYMYLGTLPANMTNNTALKMFQIADMHGIERLRKISEKTLIRRLNDDKVLKFLNFSDLHRATDLKTAAALRIAHNTN